MMLVPFQFGPLSGTYGLDQPRRGIVSLWIEAIHLMEPELAILGRQLACILFGPESAARLFCKGTDEGQACAGQKQVPGKASQGPHHRALPVQPR